MKQRIFIAVFVIVCLALVAVSVDSVNCHRANVMLRKTVTRQMRFQSLTAGTRQMELQRS